LLFASQEDAHSFDLSGSRVRGGVDAAVDIGAAGAGDARGGSTRIAVGSMRAGAIGGTSRPARSSIARRGGGELGMAWRPWNVATQNAALAALAVLAGAVAACLLLRRLKQRTGHVKQLDEHARNAPGPFKRSPLPTRLRTHLAPAVSRTPAGLLCMESPNERPGTESKRKGRGRKDRPRLPMGWVQPAACSRQDSSGIRSDDYPQLSEDPIPFDLGADASVIATDKRGAVEGIGLRRAFECSQSFQELADEVNKQSHASPAVTGCPLVVGSFLKARDSGAEPSPVLHDDYAPHRRTPRHSYDDLQINSRSCFAV
jgi:hypothetical protein